jgi:transposase
MQVGIDTHKDSLAVAGVDAAGAAICGLDVSNDPAGHQQLVEWLAALTAVDAIGVEGSGGYGVAIARRLLAEGHTVVEVPVRLTASGRTTQRKPGKTDHGDAVVIARVVLRERRLPPVRMPGPAEDLKLLSNQRDHLNRERRQLIGQVHADLSACRPGYTATVAKLTRPKHWQRVRRLLTGDDSVRADIARARLRRLVVLDRELTTNLTQIQALLTQVGTTLADIPGVGPVVAARFLGEVGTVTRLANRDQFAALNGTAPIPASSGRTTRHRLNRGGNRKLNYALHIIAVTQARHYPPAQAYVTRRTAQGKTRREAIRCLKRHLSNVIYRALVNDQATNPLT